MNLRHFDSAIFVTQFDFDTVGDFEKIEEKICWAIENMKINKVYLETHRSGIYVEKEKILKAKRIFEKYGVKVAGGITFTESYNADYQQLFGTLCYSNEWTLNEIKKIVSYTSEMFDEYIIDDFYFTHCKCDKCIEKKGDGSWSEFRLNLLKEVAENVVIKESKAIRSDVKVILKYPNWYDHYQKSGYNLEMATSLFDGVYTGTETRNPLYTQQNIQRYSSYFIMRYIENTKPGANRGGWFDTFDCSYNLNSVVEQANLTLFAKAKECTFFNLGALLTDDAIYAPLLGYIYQKFDKFAENLGRPKGIATYKPFHSSGEDFIHGYLGMLGIPFEPVPYFPEHEKVLFLTETAAYDKEIIPKIKKYLSSENTLILTSGFVRRLQGKDIEEIADVLVTQNKGIINEYGLEWRDCAYRKYYEAKEKIMLTQIDFGANDTKNTISGLKNNKSYPILLETHYSRGQVYVLNIPDEYGALMCMPSGVINEIRRVMMKDMFFDIEGKGPFGLFVYDNSTFIVYSFNQYSVDYDILLDEKYDRLVDLETGFEFKGKREGNQTRYSLLIKPSYYKVLRAMRE